MGVSVFLADLRHTYMGVLSSDAMPLNVGYMKAVIDRDVPEVRSRVFAYPEKLLEALRASPPDLLMLSNYTWNEQLALHFARLHKQLRPEGLAVLGGPNIHDDPQRQEAFLLAHPEIDIYVLGEGDFVAAEIVREFLHAQGVVDRLLEAGIPSSIRRFPDGTIGREQAPKRQRNLEDIPSPWLTGVMDEFFDGRLAPIWETNRGCPFSCSFCVQGTDYYNRVAYFDEERLREEINYIGRMVHERSPAMGTLRIADPNYGMYRRDPVISGYIGEVQRKYRFPTFIDATTGKNRPDRIIESLEKVGGALVLYQAVQSLDEDVLRKVKRQSIKLEAYEALQVHMRGRGLKSSSDLILGLPGESLDTHLAGLYRMIDAGVTKLNNFQCMMLKGSELERQDSRDLFEFETRYRVVPKSFGLIEDQLVFEDEEIVVATDTLSFDDYLRARLHHLACAVFLNNGRLEILFRLVEVFDGKRSDLFKRLVRAMDQGNARVRKLVSDFLDETRNELFSTRESMVEYYQRPDNLERLKRSEIGDNLVYKSSSMASLKVWADVCRLALDSTREELESLGSGEVENFDELWASFELFEMHRYASGATLEALVTPVSLDLRYDIDGWIGDGMPKDFGPYRFQSRRLATLGLCDDDAREVTNAVETYGLSPSGAIMLIKRIRADSLQRGVNWQSLPPG